MLRKIASLAFLSAAVLGASAAQAALIPIDVAFVGGNSGNQSGNAITTDIPGSTVTRISAGAFNALTPAQLRANYDAIVITWNSPGGLNADWNTRLLPYLNLGGGVVFDGDDNNVGDLAPGVTAFSYNTSGPITVTPVPGLTDGVVSNQFDNMHARFTAWDPNLSPFLTHAGNTVGLYGEIGNGRIVLTGPDNDYHGFRNGNANQSNQYQLLLNSLIYVTTPVPEPASIAVWSLLGVAGLAGARRRRKSRV